jgi:hypothetical protein
MPVYAMRSDSFSWQGMHHTGSAHSSSSKLTCIFIGKLLVSYTIDPQPDVPTGMTPKAQCAFEILALNVSAIRAT